jgi:hypothetical protein
MMLLYVLYSEDLSKFRCLILDKLPTKENYNVGAIQKMYICSENFGSDSILF